MPVAEDPRLLTGHGTFVDDVQRPGTLHACFVRSPVARARIEGVDTSEALALPGVHAVLTAEDVIHSLFLPDFRVKQDAVPGMEMMVWFQPTRTGEFVIGCAELCGIGHTTMGGKLIVESEEAFQSWLDDTLEMFGEHEPEDDPNWKYWKETR